MPRTRKNLSGVPRVASQTLSQPAGLNGPMGEVLTLPEAAAYLRLPESEVTRLIETQNLPGRFTGSEWRFLKSALQEWLGTPTRRKRGILAHIGAFKDDPDVEAMARDAEWGLQGRE